MDTLLDAYREEEEEEEEEEDEDEDELARRSDNNHHSPADFPPETTNTTTTTMEVHLENGIKHEPIDSTSPSEDDLSGEDPKTAPKPTNNSDEDEEDDDDDDDDDDPPPKKRKQLSSLTPQQLPPPSSLPDSSSEQQQQQNGIETTTPTTAKVAKISTAASKKAKKKNNNVWTKPTSRKGKKKGKSNNTPNAAAAEDTVLITPIPRFPDKSDDTPDMEICLSKTYKAEKVELGDDRLSAGSTKGYRMVRATRGVTEGAWYFEIRVVKMGETGHTRLGWSTDKGDLQAPVGYDSNSFGYRDIDGSKVHKAMREKYGEEEGYKEGDVIGFYINLPNGEIYAPKPPHLVWFKGQRYVCPPDGKEDPPKVVSGSEISFFKNGVCQGVAFSDLYGGRYYPAASMYTLPNQPNCVVKFNFGPDFEFFPEDFDGRLVPKPMIEVPYHGYDGRVENGVSDEKKQ